MTPFITGKLGDAHEGIKLTLRKVTEKSCSLGFCSAGMAARAAELGGIVAVCDIKHQVGQTWSAGSWGSSRGCVTFQLLKRKRWKREERDRSRFQLSEHGRESQTV